MLTKAIFVMNQDIGQVGEKAKAIAVSGDSRDDR
jgi:hypothetical protein